VVRKECGSGAVPANADRQFALRVKREVYTVVSDHRVGRMVVTANVCSLCLLQFYLLSSHIFQSCMHLSLLGVAIDQL
jgi:hypothetical protein